MNKCNTKHHDTIKEKISRSEDFLQNVTKASEIFSLLGDATRAKILLALSEGELCVYHICEITGGKQSAISQHLRKLKDSHLVKCRKEANQVLYSLADSHVSTLINSTIEHLNCK